MNVGKKWKTAGVAVAVGAKAKGGDEAAASRVVRVLVDVPAIDKTFDYLLPDALPGAADVRLGTIVRIRLHGRRVGAWVVGVNVVPAVPIGELLAVTKVSSFGPPRELLSLAKWAAWRWWGRPATFLQIASPNATVRAMPALRRFDPDLLPLAAANAFPGFVVAALQRALNQPIVTVVRLPPLADPFALLIEAARVTAGRGLLILVPHVATARDLARRFRRLGAPVALLPDEWARAAQPGAIVIGARTAAWAPAAGFAAVVVLDEHDEAYQDERAPTWHAREVVIERARRIGAACLLVSPVPSPHALTATTGGALAPDRRAERAGWPVIELVDRTNEEPGRVPIVAPALTKHLRDGGRVVCILNRTGRAKLLDCRTCATLAECERCGAALTLPAQGSTLVCGRCAHQGPIVCRACGGGRMRQLRPGTTRLREDLEALAQRPVIEITGASVVSASSRARPRQPGDLLGEPGGGGRGEQTLGADTDNTDVMIGTEAALHRVGRADTVVFLDIDGELLAPRMRSADAVVAMVVRAARLVGPTGRIMMVTRQPDHPILRALVLADVEAICSSMVTSLAALGYEPPAAVAVVSGMGASRVAEGLGGSTSDSARSLERVGPAVGPFVVRSPSIDALADALADVSRPAERVRVEVDPDRW